MTAADGVVPGFSACDLRTLGDRFGTPLYVVSLDRLREDATRLASVLNPVGVRLLYSLKTNYLPAIVRSLAAEGLGVDVVSGYELRAALDCGVPGDRIVFNGPVKTEEELAEALQHGVFVNIDGAEEIRTLARLAAERGTGPLPVGLRVYPPHNVFAEPGALATRALPSKFGWPIATGAADEIADRIMAEPLLRLTGVHCHLGSQIVRAENLLAALDAVCAWTAHLRTRTALTVLNIGGGFGVEGIHRTPGAIATLSAPPPAQTPQENAPAPPQHERPAHERAVGANGQDASAPSQRARPDPAGAVRADGRDDPVTSQRERADRAGAVSADGLNAPVPSQRARPDLAGVAAGDGQDGSVASQRERIDRAAAARVGERDGAVASLRRRFDVALFAEGLAGVLHRHGLDDLMVFAEPGRALVSAAGVLLTRVVGRKDLGEHRWILLDGGLSLMPTAGVAEKHGFVPLVPDDGRTRPCLVGGPLCYEGDVFGVGVELPEGLSAGDYVVVQDAGAYGFSRATSFNRLRPATVTVSGESVELAWEAETYESLMSPASPARPTVEGKGAR
ncbi:diaminopimelate decarboxylase family protein [Actinomadura rupiterrae]|uniref:diaminopimelate decarboxylase family protein n=1 Tax=Actinomadura rupiterrae TaxID=559627 RepID=UPI0020A2C0FD|nr:hypothetical protein [Actinomadura rupiterrae]MCP2342803.1 diaminopimelate decarboxylase [Actinomadura rupiterrae]